MLRTNCEAVMWKITTRGFTLEEVLIMAAMNLLTSALIPPKTWRTADPDRGAADRQRNEGPLAACAAPVSRARRRISKNAKHRNRHCIPRSSEGISHTYPGCLVFRNRLFMGGFIR